MATLNARMAVLDMTHMGINVSRFPLPCGCTAAQQERSTHAWDCPAVVRAGRGYRKQMAFPYLYGVFTTPELRAKWATWVNEGGVPPTALNVRVNPCDTVTVP